MKIRSIAALFAALALLTACGTDAPKAASDTSATEVVEEQISDTEEPAGDAAEVEPTEEPEPEPTEAPTPEVTNMAVGETVTVTTVDSELLVQLVGTKTSSTPPDEYTEPPTNGLWLGILIQYACAKGSCDYNPYDFVLRGPDGAEYDTAFVYDDPTFEPELQSGTLNAGVPAKGYIVYDVKPGNYSLEYRANIFDGQAASWNVSAA
jgi:hypothetical protein